METSEKFFVKLYTRNKSVFRFHGSIWSIYLDNNSVLKTILIVLFCD